jgi:nifR3 family TIM-barrel protein
LNFNSQQPLPAKAFLAPMAGITDKAFRIYMSRLGAPVVMTELISSEGYVHGSKRTREMLEISPHESPCGVQIFGHRPRVLAELATYAQDHGASFIDLNFGCPVNKVTKCGAGSAALKDLPFMGRIIRAARAAIHIPLSIKIRTGWDESSIVAKDVCRLAEDEGVDWVSIHGRSKEMGYRGPNNWDLIAECQANSRLPIIGNGELKTAEDCLSQLNTKSCAAVMVGRAALVNPLIFNEINGSNQPLSIKTLELIQLYMDIAEQHIHPKVRLVKIKKMAAWLSVGSANSSHFRSHLMRDIQDRETLWQSCLDYFGSDAAPNIPKDLSFLKGGHG